MGKQVVQLTHCISRRSHNYQLPGSVIDALRRSNPLPHSRGFERPLSFTHLDEPNKPTFRFTKHMRLSQRREFEAVFAAKISRYARPLVVYGLPNRLGHNRLGLSVSRQVGNAVKRNRIKRLLRESFRLSQHDLPSGYDLVVVVKPHDTMVLIEYQQAFAKCVSSLDKHFRASKCDNAFE